MQYSYLHYGCEFGQHWNYNLTPCNVKIKHILQSQIHTGEKYLNSMNSFLKLNFLSDGDEGEICANVSIFYFSVCFKVRMEREES